MHIVFLNIGKINRKSKNKIIIIGKHGVGKSYDLDYALKKKGKFYGKEN